MDKYSVFLDTSFLINFLNPQAALHQNARAYYKYFLENNIPMKVSTIAIAEYCVKGDIGELPLRDLQIAPFNINDAKRTGEFAQIVFDRVRSDKMTSLPRLIIPNDTKLFAQTDLSPSTKYFVTSDAKSQEVFSIIDGTLSINFEIIDINRPYNISFGILDLQK